MQEQDFIETYHKRLAHYKKEFERDRVFPFTEIKFMESGKKKITAKIFFNFFDCDIILIPSKYLEISNEIIEFAAVLSFLPENFRFSYLTKLIFLLKFKKSDKKPIKPIWSKIRKYCSDTFNELFFNDVNLKFFWEEISLSELISGFAARLNPPYKEGVFFSIFNIWITSIYSKKINIGTIREITELFSGLKNYDDYIKIN